MSNMIRKIEVTDYPRLMEIWESAVLSTHDFLKKEDFLYYKEQFPVYFQNVTLFGFEQEGDLIGFMGIAEGNLEMLFIDSNYRGTGIGKKMIAYAINNLQVTKVDVNEQNTQAVGFYKHIGFDVYKRSELDGEGKEYPILHMHLQ
jgi:putative acetyltransferase